MSSSCTSRIGKLALLAVCGVSFLGFSQTADTLKARFASLLGANRFAKLVFQVEGNDGRKPNFDVGGMWQSNPSKLMAMDTKDGILRQFAGPKAGTHYASATFTWDGLKVIYTDNVQHQVLIVDWADTTKKTVLKNYEGDGHCYQTSDGKNWVLATQYLGSGATGAKLQRINVADTSEKVNLFTCTWARVEWGGTVGAGATCWASISPDGKYVGGGWPNYGQVGILTVASGSVRQYSPTGCWPTIARDTTGDVMYTSDGNDAHKAVTIVNKAGTSIFHKGISSALGGTNNEHESLRWTSDRDFVTLWAYAPGFIGKGMPNPRLIQISTLKWAAVVDNPLTSTGNMDVFYYSTSNIAQPQSHTPMAIVASGKNTSDHVFDVCGRAMKSGLNLKYGVYVSARDVAVKQLVRSASPQ